MVAEGFTHQYGLVYKETFAPIAQTTTVCTLLTVASIRQWSLSQLDFKNACVNENLQDDVCMVPPPRLVFLIILDMFANSRMHFMVSNRHLVPGLRGFLLLLPLLGLHLIIMTLPYSFDALQSVTFYFYYMLMT